MKKFLLSLSAFATLTATAQVSGDCQNLFISEYYEGFGNNKAIEIYNPSASSVNLGEYFLARLNNGNAEMRPFGTDNSNCHQLPNVTLDAHSTFVIVLDRTEANAADNDPAVWIELRAKADVLMSSSYAVNSSMNFNGNDALLLVKGLATNPNVASSRIYDIFGRPGEDPEVNATRPGGWSTVAPYNNSAGVIVTVNHKLIRKQGIKKGISNYLDAMNTPFNPLLEWDSTFALLNTPRLDGEGNIIYQENNPGVPERAGNWETLGWHVCECDPSSLSTMGLALESIEMYPNPTSGVVTLSNIETVAVIEVANALGQVVFTETNEGKNVLSFEINDKSGIYFVTIKDRAGKSATRKLIVQ